jgi:hypothetical protein
MGNQNKVRCIFVPILLILISLSMGCALGVTRVKISHDPLNRVENKKEGNILVNQFKDVRPQAKKEYIGNKRNMFGMVLGNIGPEEGVSLTDVLTNYFVEAMREAGYTVVVSKGTNAPQESEKMKFDAMIDGEIIEFWLDLYMAVWHYTTIKLTAKHPDSKEVLWEKVIHGEEKNTLWLGATSEYEKAIRQSLTKALNKTASELASEDFFKAVKGK